MIDSLSIAVHAFVNNAKYLEGGGGAVDVTANGSENEIGEPSSNSTCNNWRSLWTDALGKDMKFFCLNSRGVFLRLVKSCLS